MKATRALGLAALVLLATLPTVEAAGPEPRPWSGYPVISETAAIAIAKEGTTIALALREASVASPAPAPVPLPGLPGGTAPTGAETDLVILDHQYGFARNTSVNPPAPQNQVSVPQGRSHVAVSRDGTSVATLGIEKGAATGGGGTTTDEYVRFYYGRVEPGGNWSGTTPFETRVDLGGTNVAAPIGVALSDDGRRAAILYSRGTDYVLRGYTMTSGSLSSSFERIAPGVPRALAASGDLSRILVVGQFAEGNFTYGGGKLFPFSVSGTPATFLDGSANNTDARGGAISRDGRTVAIGGADGKLHLFRNVGETLGAPATASLGAAPLANLTMSEDGTRLATAGGTTLSVIDLTSDLPRSIFNATLAGQNATVPAMDRTGSIILVGTSGTGGALYGFSDVDAQPLWTIPGETRGVAIDSKGERVAYAQRAAAAGTRVPRALTMDLASGGKVAPQVTVNSPGQMSVPVILRNDGAGLERVVFEEQTPDANVTTDPVVVNVRPGAILTVNVTVTIAEGLTSPRVFQLAARSLSSGLTDNVTLSIAPRPTLDVKLFLNQTDLLAEPGRPTTVFLTVTNNGTGDANVALRATQTVSAGPAWDVQLSETSLTAIRGTRSTITVTVTPPVGVANGTASEILFTLEGQDVFDTERLTLRVNPELRLEVRADPPTRYLTPGQRGSYNVTVTNAGSLPRDVEIFYTIEQSSGLQWGVTMDSTTVRLEPTSFRVIEVQITAPANAQPDQLVGVRVTAQSLPEPNVVNDTRVNDTVTIFAIAIAPKITTPTNQGSDIPSIAPGALFASFALLALLLRRRR